MFTDHPNAVGLAERQHGLVTRQQLMALGIPGPVIDGWVRRGQLQRVHRAVYRIPGFALSERQELLAAVLRCGPGARADGWASCALHRLEGFELPKTPGVVVPLIHRPSPRGIDVAAVPLERTDDVLVDGIPAMGVARALIEVAPLITERALRVAIDSARRRCHLTIDRLRLRAQNLLHLEGARIILRVIGSGVMDPESEGERRLQATLDGVEGLEWGVEDLVPGRRLDCLMRDAALALEYDGRDHHVLPTDRDADGMRDLEVTSVTIDGMHVMVLRITKGMLDEDAEGVRRAVLSLRASRREELRLLRSARALVSSEMR
jgi:hypothetical protein